MKKTFDITGMSCSSCSSNIEKTILKLKGVKTVNVNLLLNKMLVNYDEKIIVEKDIIKAVKDIGFGITEEQKSNISENEIKKDINKMKTRVIVSMLFLIFVMYFAMYHMFHMWFGIPIPNIIYKYFSGLNNGMTLAITQFILLIPIVIVNFEYFTNGFKSLLKRNPNMNSLVAIGSTAAIIYGVFAMLKIGYGLKTGDINSLKYSENLYFESAAMILSLITLGKYLEMKSKGRTNEAIIKLMELAPKTVLVERNKKEIEIEIDDIEITDIVIIKPGGKIPVDGIILEGVATIDQSTITRREHAYY
ncbi:MAG: cation transporter [Clostridia bacterium]|nr:cation transporter [Clostridia bacterium]MDD4376253.1 cation transporter [Clostridia bacterium]